MKGRRLFTYLLALVVIAVMSIFMTACGGSDAGGYEEAAADDAAKVKVGISWQEDIDAEEHGEDLMAYINTVEKAGGEPVLLDLVKDQEYILLVAELAQSGEERRFRRQNTALALHRLQNHRAGPVVYEPLHTLQIIEIGEHDAAHQRAERILIMGVTRH